MELQRWTNPHQPQTLQIGVFLMYIRAVFVVLPGFLTTYDYWAQPIPILAAAGLVLGGLGTANNKRWGYRLAVGVTALGVYPLARWLIDVGPRAVVDFDFVLIALFPVAQLIVLLHPLSRNHQRIWFD